MTDSGSGNVIGKFTDEVEQAAGEVGQDMKDAVGEMIEQGVKSVADPTLTAQQLQQKQQEDQKKEIDRQKQLAYTRNWLKNLEASQKRVREEEKQKRLQKQQLEEQEKQKKKMEEQARKTRIISPARKAPPMPGQPTPVVEEIARTRQEIGKGHGVGG